MRCNHCEKELDNVLTINLPVIGYGSAFDTLDEEEYQYRFNVCPDCMKKMNTWLKKQKPNLNLSEFWSFKIVDVPDNSKKPNGQTHQEFEYEDLLFDLYVKFMPEKVFGEKYRLPRLMYWIESLLR